MPKNSLAKFNPTYLLIVAKYRTSFQKVITIFEKSKKSDVDAFLSDFLL